MGIEIFKKHLREKRAIKISIDAKNYNLENIAKICRAAQAAKASAVEIVSDSAVYSIARKNTKLPLFVSSVHPFEILNAVKLGVDAIQIGPYFDIYKKGKKFNGNEIYDIVLETLGLINDYNVFTCVTIPASISFEEQCELIKKLEILGVDLIQTEGYKKSAAIPDLIAESSEFSIKAMNEISKYTNLPIMTTSAMNFSASKLAFQNGANAVNIDSYISKLDSEASMKMAIMEIVGSIAYRNSLNKEIIRSERELLINKF